MPRQPRYTLVGIPQYVIQRGNNRQATFFTEQDYPHYLEYLRNASSSFGCLVHAYALMANQVHLLMSPLYPHAIAKVMQSVGRRYVRYANDSYRRTGTLWEGRYKACPIDPERYLLTCYRYLELNPVRANMVTQPGAYRWSSYGYHARGQPDALIRDHAQYLALGRTVPERNAAYRELCCVYLDEAVLSIIRRTIDQCLVLGCERFKDQIEQTLARKVRRGKVGRPRKEIAVRP